MVYDMDIEILNTFPTIEIVGKLFINLHIFRKSFEGTEVQILS